jgi:hypothetical protein
VAIRPDFTRVSALQLKVRALEHRIAFLEAGSAYAALAEEKRLFEVRASARIKKLTRELASQERLSAKMRRCWFDIFEQIERERDRALSLAAKDTARATERALRAERRVDGLLDELKDSNEHIRRLKDTLSALGDLNAKFSAQINRDFENSSLPSSAQGPARKRIPNTREVTEKKAGGQPGHPHHPRKIPQATTTVKLSDPESFAADPDLYRTDKVTSKFLVKAQVSVEVIEYKAQIWRRHSNGTRLHAPFPEGLSDEVTYDASVKAMAFLLTNECCASLRKAKTYLFEASHGKLDLSVGMISGLASEFSRKSLSERSSALASLMTFPVMHADFTSANVSGEGRQVLILAGGDTTMLAARKSKGHKGIEGSALEGYVGCVVHDHDTTFYSYGTTHQECMQHNIRYLVGSIQNEPHLTWNVRMLALLREMLHWRNSCDFAKVPDPGVIADYERRYDEVLLLAALEYDKSPPTKYYRNGYNLFLRLRDFKESQLRFLHDKRVPADNSLCERLARVFKRKMRQAIVFRSFESLGYVCEAIGTINNMRVADKDVFSEVSTVFGRPKSG